jgi:hypothetical protein
LKSSLDLSLFLAVWIACFLPSAFALEFTASSIKIDGSVMSVALRDLDGDGRINPVVAHHKTDDGGVDRRTISV